MDPLSKRKNRHYTNMGKYRTDEQGNVYNGERKLKPTMGKWGYKYIKGVVSGNRYCWYVHIMVAKQFIPNPDDLDEVDHINRDRGDNRVENLRWTSRHNNNGNSVKWTKPCSSKYKGVSWSKGMKKWHVYIKNNGKRRTIGYFEGEEDAALAYNHAALELWGEFAKVNVL